LDASLALEYLFSLASFLLSQGDYLPANVWTKFLFLLHSFEIFFILKETHLTKKQKKGLIHSIPQFQKQTQFYFTSFHAHSPSVVLSLGIAAVVALLASLCYAECASIIPVAGSAYVYTYTLIGELPAWIVGKL
jgi:type II secretory pathway component PulF